MHLHIIILKWGPLIGGYISSVSHGSSPWKNPYVLLTKLNINDHEKNRPNVQQVLKKGIISTHKRNKTNEKQISKRKSDVKSFSERDSDVGDDIEYVSMATTHQRNKTNEKQISKRKSDVESFSERDSDVADDIEHISVATKSNRRCVFCKYNKISSRTHWQCKGCNKYLCSKRTGRPCFQLMHSLPFKGMIFPETFDPTLISKMSLLKSRNSKLFSEVPISPSKTPDSKHVSKVSLSSSKTSDSRHASKVPPSSKPPDSRHISKVLLSPSKPPDSRNVLKVSFIPSKSPDSGHISKSSSLKKSTPENRSSNKFSSEDEHNLIAFTSSRPCLYCKMLTTSKCQACNLYFCNTRTGRECFDLYHSALEAPSVNKTKEKLEVVEISSDDDSISHDSTTVQVSEKETSDVEIISETELEQTSLIKHKPLFAKDKKTCFYCKVKTSNWHCKTCGKSLCVQKTGKTCFFGFHSSSRKRAKRPDMKRVLQAYTRKSR